MAKKGGSMATAAEFQHADELLREYLVFRGFLGTLKMFDKERANDKAKQYQAERIAEQIISYITSFEIANLMELWRYLDARFFSRLDTRFNKTTKRLEQSIKRYYVIHCVQTGNHNKCRDFFEYLSDELCGDDEWRPWFVLPFLRNTETPPEFEPYFNKNWQELLSVSIHNFLSTVMAYVPLPQIIGFDRIQRENVTLRNTVDAQYRELLGIHSTIGSLKRKNAELAASSGKPQVLRAPGNSLSGSSGGATSTSSPTLGIADLDPEIAAYDPTRASMSKLRNPLNRQMGISGATVKKAATGQSSSGFQCKCTKEFRGLRDNVVLAKFSGDGDLLAAASKDKIKIFRAALSELTGSPITTCDTQSDVTCLAWNGTQVNTPNKLFLTGHSNGTVKWWNPETGSCFLETKTEHIKKRVEQISFAPNGLKCIISSCVPRSSSSHGPTGPPSSLVLWNVKLSRAETLFEIQPPSAVVRAIDFNHNGSCFVTGADDGHLRLYDVASKQPVMVFRAHEKSMDCVRYKGDETSVFTVGSDNMVVEWSIHMAGKVLNSFHLPAIEEVKKSKSSVLQPHSMGLSPDGKHLLVSPPCGLYELIPPADGNSSKMESVSVSGLPTVGIQQVDWHPASNMMFASVGQHDSYVKFWELSSTQ